MAQVASQNPAPAATPDAPPVVPLDLDALRPALAAAGVQVAYLIGSVALGRAGPLSDVDLAVLLGGEGAPSLDAELALRAALPERVHLAGDPTGVTRPLDVVLLDTAPPPIRFAAARDGILVYAAAGPAGRDAHVAFVESALRDFHDTRVLREEHWTYLRERVLRGLSMSKADGSGPRLDRARLRSLIDSLGESLVRLRQLARVEEAALLAPENWHQRSVLEREMEKAIEATLAMGRHIIAVRGLRAPQEYSDVGRRLAAGIVPDGLATALAGMARLRTLLVHVYWETDHRMLLEFARPRLGDFDAFAQRPTPSTDH